MLPVLYPVIRCATPCGTRALMRFEAAKTPQIRKLQNSTLSANWICRGLPCVVVTCPAPPPGASENGPELAVPPDCVPTAPSENIPADGRPRNG